MEQKRRDSSDSLGPLEAMAESPRHGFQGDRAPTTPLAQLPASLTIALSREAGARGASIGRRVGERLGWQVYDQELLEYIAQEGPLRQEVLDERSPDVADWAEQRLQYLVSEQRLSQHPPIISLARVMLALGARGQVVLIGRGAGLMLPRSTTLHARIVAPLEDRIAYLSQWLRLTREEAAEIVRQRDNLRADFLTTNFHLAAADIYPYDLLLNSSRLGEDGCADLLVHAARAKLARL